MPFSPVKLSKIVKRRWGTCREGALAGPGGSRSLEVTGNREHPHQGGDGSATLESAPCKCPTHTAPEK